MKTPIGIDKNTDEIRLINDVESGLKCNCICPACKAPLVARKGKVNAHHFSHHKCSEQKACRETAIHLMAKYVIKESSTVLFPTMTFRSKIRKTLLGESILHEATHCNDPQSIYDCREEVYLAKHKIKPDILCKTEISGESAEVAIEIVVSHKVDDEKLEKIKNAALTTFEINLADLTDVDTITFDDIRKALADRYRLSWVFFNPLLETKLKDELQAQTDTELFERNTVITKWGNNVRNHFQKQGSINTPPYNLSKNITDPKVQTIENKYVRVSLPSPPNLKKSYPIHSVDDVLKAILGLCYINTVYTCPM